MFYNPVKNGSKGMKIESNAFEKPLSLRIFIIFGVRFLCQPYV